jgi:hypothetical protein
MQASPIETAASLGLETLEKVQDRLAYRSAHKENIDVDQIRDLNIEWHDQGPSKSKAGYYARIGQKDLRLSDGAMKTACRLLKTEPKYFSQFEDRAEFPRALVKGIDEGKRKNKGVLVRTNGLEVTSILSRDYKIRDAATLLNDFLEPLKDNMGDVKGVYALEQGDGDICSYRVVMGANLLPSIDAKLGQYLMFVLSTSENGIVPTKSTLGLYRTICTNSAIRQQELCQWDHKTEFGRFYDDTASTIRTSGYFQNAYSRIFSDLIDAKLEVPALDLVSAFSEGDLLTSNHADLARLYVMAPTEDGRGCENQYDLFNALTRAARDLPSIQARELAESKTLKLFTDAGGIREALRLAADKASRREKAQSGNLLMPAE